MSLFRRGRSSGCSADVVDRLVIDVDRQPIGRPSKFVAIHNAAERKTVVGFLDLQYRLRRRGIGIVFKRLLFDVTTAIGEVRPDMVVDLRDFATGEVMDAALEVLTAMDADSLGMKLRQVERLRSVAPAVTIHDADLEGDTLGAAILDQLRGSAGRD